MLVKMVTGDATMLVHSSVDRNGACLRRKNEGRLPAPKYASELFPWYAPYVII